MLAGQVVEGRPLPDLVVIVAEHVRCIREQLLQPALSFYHGQAHQIFAVQEQQIEQEQDQRTLAGIAGVLDQIERRLRIGEHTAEFAIKVGVLRRQSGNRLGDSGVFVRPVVASAGQDLHSAAIETRVHPIPIQLDLMQPVGAIRGLFDESGELRLDPGWRVVAIDDRLASIT
jgi:hypothetical protein